MTARVWTHDHEGTRGWHARLRIGRLQLGWHIYRHTYPTTSDRWVLQPFAIYDRKEAGPV